jgi:heme/copper-type cytochrome/quinol oxidase subunit 4
MQSHGSQPSIILVLAGLLVLTAIEYLFSQMGAGLTLLLVVAFFKFLLVIIYFMHLPRLWSSPSPAEVEVEKDQE